MFGSFLSKRKENIRKRKEKKMKGKSLPLSFFFPFTYMKGK